MQTIVHPADMQQVVYQSQPQLWPQTVVSANGQPLPMVDEPIDFSIGPNLPGAHVCVCVCVCVCARACVLNEGANAMDLWVPDILFCFHTLTHTCMYLASVPDWAK